MRFGRPEAKEDRLSEDQRASDSVPLTQSRDFWALMGYAVALGIFGAFVGLAFMGVTGAGNNWFSSSDFDWFGGDWWWVAATTAAGLAVGLLHRLMRLPAETRGLIDDLKAAHVDAQSVPAIVAVSAVSLIGGASLGPEKALGSLGGGAAGWFARRRGRDAEDQEASTLFGFAGAYGGLFSSTVIVVMLILEVARPGGAKLTKTLAGSIVASSVSFGIYFAIGGAFFLDAYRVPAFAYHDWQLPAGVAFGLVAAVLVTVLAVVVKLTTALFARVQRIVLRATIGGALFGLVGVVLPLTMFTGSDQLKSVLNGTGTLGAALLVALVIAKMLTFATCQASGFVGGPIFPALFIGGTAGAAVHELFPSVPLGVAFACLLAAVPGAVVAAPFAMVLLAAFMTQVGTLQTAPVLLAVITAYFATEAVKYLVASRGEKEKAEATDQRAPDRKPAPAS